MSNVDVILSLVEKILQHSSSDKASQLAKLDLSYYSLTPHEYEIFIGYSLSKHWFSNPSDITSALALINSKLVHTSTAIDQCFAVLCKKLTSLHLKSFALVSGLVSPVLIYSSHHLSTLLQCLLTLSTSCSRFLPFFKSISNSFSFALSCKLHLPPSLLFSLLELAIGSVFVSSYDNFLEDFLEFSTIFSKLSALSAKHFPNLFSTYLIPLSTHCSLYCRYLLINVFNLHVSSVDDVISNCRPVEKANCKPGTHVVISLQVMSNLISIFESMAVKTTTFDCREFTTFLKSFLTVCDCCNSFKELSLCIGSFSKFLFSWSIHHDYSKIFSQVFSTSTQVFALFFNFLLRSIDFISSNHFPIYDEKFGLYFGIGLGIFYLTHSNSTAISTFIDTLKSGKNRFDFIVFSGFLTAICSIFLDIASNGVDLNFSKFFTPTLFLSFVLPKVIQFYLDEYLVCFKNFMENFDSFLTFSVSDFGNNFDCILNSSILLQKFSRKYSTPLSASFCISLNSLLINSNILAKNFGILLQSICNSLLFSGFNFTILLSNLTSLFFFNETLRPLILEIFSTNILNFKTNDFLVKIDSLYGVNFKHLSFFLSFLPSSSFSTLLRSILFVSSCTLPTSFSSLSTPFSPISDASFSEMEHVFTRKSSEISIEVGFDSTVLIRFMQILKLFVSENSVSNIEILNQNICCNFGALTNAFKSILSVHTKSLEVNQSLNLILGFLQILTQIIALNEEEDSLPLGISRFLLVFLKIIIEKSREGLFSCDSSEPKNPKISLKKFDCLKCSALSQILNSSLYVVTSFPTFIYNSAPFTISLEIFGLSLSFLAYQSNLIALESCTDLSSVLQSDLSDLVWGKISNSSPFISSLSCYICLVLISINLVNGQEKSRESLKVHLNSLVKLMSPNHSACFDIFNQIFEPDFEFSVEILHDLKSVQDDCSDFDLIDSVVSILFLIVLSRKKIVEIFDSNFNELIVSELSFPSLVLFYDAFVSKNLVSIIANSSFSVTSVFALFRIFMEHSNNSAEILDVFSSFFSKFISDYHLLFSYCCNDSLVSEFSFLHSLKFLSENLDVPSYPIFSPSLFYGTSSSFFYSFMSFAPGFNSTIKTIIGHSSEPIFSNFEPIIFDWKNNSPSILLKLVYFQSVSLLDKSFEFDLNLLYNLLENITTYYSIVPKICAFLYRLIILIGNHVIFLTDVITTRQIPDFCLSKILAKCPLLFVINSYSFFSRLLSENAHFYLQPIISLISSHSVTTTLASQVVWSLPCSFLQSSDIVNQSNVQSNIESLLTVMKNTYPFFQSTVDFRRAMSNVVNDPVDLISRSANSLQSMFKTKSAIFASSVSKGVNITTLINDTFEPFLSKLSLLISRVESLTSSLDLLSSLQSFLIDFKTILTLSSHSTISNHLSLFSSRLTTILTSAVSSSQEPLDLQSNLIDLAPGVVLPLLFINDHFSSPSILSIFPSSFCLSSQTLPRLVFFSTTHGSISLLVKPADPCAEVATFEILSNLDAILCFNALDSIQLPKTISFISSNSSLSVVGSFFLKGSPLVKAISPLYSPFNLSKKLKNAIKPSKSLLWKHLSLFFSSSSLSNLSSFWDCSDSFLSSLFCSWVIGLGDRHQGNFLFSTSNHFSSIVNLDFGQILGTSRFLPVPETVGLRLTPLIKRSLSPWKRDDDVIVSFFTTILNCLSTNQELVMNALSLYRLDPPITSSKAINHLKGLDSICQTDLRMISVSFASFSEISKSLFNLKQQREEIDQTLIDYSSEMNQVRDQIKPITSSLKELNQSVSILIDHFGIYSCPNPSNQLAITTINQLQSNSLLVLTKYCPNLSKSELQNLAKILAELPRGMTFHDPLEAIAAVREFFSNYSLVLSKFDCEYTSIKSFNKVSKIKKILNQVLIHLRDSNVSNALQSFSEFSDELMSHDELAFVENLTKVYQASLSIKKMIESFTFELVFQILPSFVTLIQGITRHNSGNLSPKFNQFLADFRLFVSSIFDSISLSSLQSTGFDSRLIVISFVVDLIVFISNILFVNSKYSLKGFGQLLMQTFVLTYLIVVCQNSIWQSNLIKKLKNLIGLAYSDRELISLCSILQPFSELKNPQELISNLLSALPIIFDRFLTRISELSDNIKSNHHAIMSMNELHSKLKSTITSTRQKPLSLLLNLIPSNDVFLAISKLTWFFKNFNCSYLFGDASLSVEQKYLVSSFSWKSLLKSAQIALDLVQKSLSNPMPPTTLSNLIGVLSSCRDVLIAIISYESSQVRLDFEFLNRRVLSIKNQLTVLDSQNVENLIHRQSKLVEDQSKMTDLITSLETNQNELFLSLSGVINTILKQIEGLKAVKEYIANNSCQKLKRFLDSIFELSKSRDLSRFQEDVLSISQSTLIGPALSFCFDLFNSLLRNISSENFESEANPANSPIQSQNVKDFVQTLNIPLADRRAFAVSEINNCSLKLLGHNFSVDHYHSPLVCPLSLRGIVEKLVQESQREDLLARVYTGWMSFC
ncbi:hypothetical protein RCL1_004594 [Eukaryota sp. TZLM3-RCL]